MKGGEPYITIGMTTYNRPEFLRESVESVLRQTSQDFELIISNDYLAVPVTFDSLGVAYDIRISIVNQAINLGEVSNMNYLLNTARGEWFMWLADDDMLHPDFLAIACRTILENPAMKVSGFFSNFASAANPFNVFPRALNGNKCSFFDRARFLKDYSHRKIALVGVYGLMRTDLLRKNGGVIQLGNSFSPYSDNLIPIMLVQHGHIAWLDEQLIFLRTHAGSISSNSTVLSAFTSAEDDFLDYLEPNCAADRSNVNAEQIKANMIRWFAHNELAVLLRDSSLKIVPALKLFFAYQVKYHLPRLSLRYKLCHIAYALGLTTTNIIHKLKLGLHAVMRAGKH